MKIEGFLDGGLTLSPAQGGYATWNLYSRVFRAGDALRLSATGSDVPAFGPVSITAPSELIITSPYCPGTRCPDVVRSQPYLVSWGGGSVGTAQLSIGTIGAAHDQSVSVSCQAPAAAGTLTVPGSVTALLKSTAGGGYGTLGLRNGSTATFNGGDWQLSFSAVTAASGGYVSSSP